MGMDRKDITQKIVVKMNSYIRMDDVAVVGRKLRIREEEESGGLR